MAENPLIQATELAELVREQSGSGATPVLLDVRWTLAGSDRAAFDQAHIPGAVFVDLDHELAGAPGEGGRHPLPEPADLQVVLRSAGINDGSAIVVYDGGSGLASSRAWWLLRWSGLRDVRVLDGGLAAWTSGAGRPLVSGPGDPPRPGNVTVAAGAMPVVEVDAAAELAASGSGVLLDARAAARFRGEVEPLDPVAGHIPGAVNMPITDLLTADGTFRSGAELAAAFGSIGVGRHAGASASTVAASCGSGITACQLILAGELAGLELSLYPGSYSQWCALGRPVAAGA